jgi:chaperonin GroEL
MFLRHVLWHVYEQVGDGTATAAVLLQSVYNEGVRYIAAGGNPMRLRDYLQKGTRLILSELDCLARPVNGEQDLARLAEAICHDPPLARLIGEIFDIIGEYGRLEIRTSQNRQLEREYVEGLYWASPLIAREMMTDLAKLKAEVNDAAIFISNLDLIRVDQLIPVLQVTLEAGLPGLLVIANQFSSEVLAFLLANTKPDKFRPIAVKAPGVGPTQQGAALQDLVMLTGGYPFLKAAGEPNLAKIKLEELGRARRVWADLHFFGIVGGRGNPRILRQHIAELRAAYKRADNVAERQELQQRIGKLIGGSAILKIGGATNAEVRARKEMAEQTAEAIRGAIIEGVVPGGGMALLACRPALQRVLAETTNTDERAAYTILLKALEEPLRTIAQNAGYDPGQVMGWVNTAGPGHGFDVRSGQVVDIAASGLFDPARALKVAVQSAIASAALALTTEVLVHHKKPKAPAEKGPGAR